MAVVTHDLTEQQPGISRKSLRRSRTKVERCLAWLILLLGYIGSLIASQGGWSNVVALRLQLAPAVGVAILQAVLTYGQWAYDDRPWIARPARGIDAALTLAGWGPLLMGVAVAMVSGAAWAITSAAGAFDVLLDVPQPAIGAAAILLLTFAAIGAAWYPEHTLVT